MIHVKFDEQTAQMIDEMESKIGEQEHKIKLLTTAVELMQENIKSLWQAVNAITKRG